MSLYRRPSPPKPPTGLTEFEILKSSHKFLRDNEEKPASWDDHLAAKYYSSLYREFALCDLKHYKSGNFALRWRTEEEVLAGSGETTCGNTRCEHHFTSTSGSSSSLGRLLRPGGSSSSNAMVPLTTLELPFTYIEQGESKNALVKVVLCGKCLKKLMWKKTKEKERQRQVVRATSEPDLHVQIDEGNRNIPLEEGRSLKRKQVSPDQGMKTHEGDNLIESPRRKKHRQERDTADAMHDPR